MEKDVLVSHGVGHFLMEKFRDDSDGFDIYVCRTCGFIPVVNENIGLVICKTCQESGLTPQVHKVHSTWASKLFVQELESCGAGVNFTLAPYTYERHQ
jgi:DNA-directed RNA polymerase beta subunit